MIGTGIDVRVKIQDIVASQLPEYVLSESPLTDDFLKQFYISQEFQGGSVDFASNLDQYLSLDTYTEEVVFDNFELTQDIDSEDTVVHVNTTKAFPNKYGLLKVGDEIMSYTGVTTNTFTGVLRGFSGITSYSDPQNPSEAYFETTEAAPHQAGDSVTNLSTLFLKEFYNRIKTTFSPGFENIELTERVSPGTWIRQARTFYQSKGSEESIIILFKVLFGEEPTVLDLEQFLIKSSDAEFTRRDFAVGLQVEGNPQELKGKTIFQSNVSDIFGAISEIEPFTRDGQLLYKLFLFVADDEISRERKLFTVPGRTFCQKEWNGQDTLTVDTTIGFRDNGEFITADGTKFTYEDRSVNQFLGVRCEDPDKIIAVGEEIVDDIYVFGFTDDGEEVRLRLTGTLSDIDFGDDGAPFSTVGENILVDSLGENILPSRGTRSSQNYSEVVANSFIYNTSVRFQVGAVNGTEFEIITQYLDDSYIRVNDTVDILVRGSNNVILSDRVVTAVDYETATITVDDSFGIPLNTDIDIRRNQKYANSSQTDIKYGNDNVLSNVQNLYDAFDYDGNFYVATNSLPSYTIETGIIESSLVDVTLSNVEDFNSFTGEYSTLVFDTAVEFVTGDLVTYSVTEDTTPLCEPGEYYVEVLDDRRKVRLYVSPSFIGGTNFVGLVFISSVGSHIFTLESQKNRIINPQKIFRKIPVTRERQNISIDRLPQEIEGGEIAVLTNGVVVDSYISADSIYLGPLESIDGVSGGSGYSPITPPEIIVADPIIQVKTQIPETLNPTTAQATPVIKGKLESILIDPQEFDIDKVFSISVTGGNSRGATAIPQIERRKREANFDSRVVSLGGGVSPEEDSIQFVLDHNFTRGEAVVYNNKGGESIGVAPEGSDFANGRLANGGVYYASPVNNLTIQLYNSLDDLNAGINTVGLSSNFTGFGIQSFDTLSKRTLTGATITEDGGFFYYRNMNFQPESVFPAYDEIRYVGHGFSTGDLVEYGTTDTAIAGLSTENSYYVVAPDENTIKLCDAGIGATITSNFERLEFVSIEDTGIGTHNIKYPEIKAEVVVSFASTNTGTVVATPFIRGEIESVYVDEPGFYGSDILNFEKNPEVDVVTGRFGKVNPIVSLGRIIGVQILNKGRNYQSTPDLVVVDESGSGSGAILRAVVEDGEIVDVIIIKEGLGYNEDTTRIDTIDPGKNALLIPRIRRLRYNTQARFGFESLENNEYSVISYARKIREDVYNDIGGRHSPIIGWANDGNPIYGGYGLSDPEDPNSDFRALQTAYVLDTSNIPGRPSEFDFPGGIFIDDYAYTGEGDLDIYNGRYCRTPEFPNGVYAYFAGISTDESSVEKEPQFPYFIGPSFRDAPINKDDTGISQDFNLNDKPIYRNTQPYAVGSPTVGSEFIVQSYLFETQETSIESIETSKVDSISVVGAGVSYAVGDIPIFDNTQDSLSAVVSEVEGKEVISIGSSIVGYARSDVKIVRLGKDSVRVYIEPEHIFLDNDTVVFNGLSTALAGLSKPQIISVDNKYMSLYSPVPQQIAFDDFTDIFVNTLTDNFDVGSKLVIGIGSTTQEVEVLNIFPVNKAVRVRREAFGLDIPIGSPVFPVQDRFDMKVSLDDFESSQDLTYHFIPEQTIGVGFETGTSAARTYSIGNIDYNISVPVQAIYAPNHTFVDNEPALIRKDPNDASLLCRDQNGNPISIPNPLTHEDQIFVSRISKDLIGIKTDPNTANLFFAPGSGDDTPYYNIQTQRFAESANVDRIQAVVTTAEPHQLENQDKVSVSLQSQQTSGISTRDSVFVQFDEPSQSIIIDPRYAQPSDIDVAENLIFIQEHEFVRGDYVLYENDGTSIVGLETHQKYFVVPFDRDRIQLTKTRADLKSGQELYVNLESTGFGQHKFSLVNPAISIVNNNNIEFDVSDPSLFGKELKFFYDQQLTEVFETNGIDDEFVVSGVSTEGYPDGRKTITYSENNPVVIYYGLEEGGYISTSDTNANAYSSINYIDSVYGIEARITKNSDTEFSYSLPRLPEQELYDTATADIAYTTSSRTALGGLGKTRIISSGKNYQSIPEFITVQSELGQNGTLKADSKTIGKVSSIRIKNPGWGYSADNTLRPKGTIQPKISFTDSDFVVGIDIVDAGSGYQNPPNAVLVDSITRDVIDNGSIDLEVQSSSISNVIIDVAPSGMTKNVHELYTINNSNGIPILRILDLDSDNGLVTYEIQTPIFNYSTPPFAVGDRVFVENIITDNPGEESFLNSEDYGYQFFDVVGVGATNPIEVTVRYPDESRNLIGLGATFQNAFSSLVNQNIYPVFNVIQSTAVFNVGERLSYIDPQGNVFDTDLVVTESNTNFFKVTGSFDLLVGDSFKGQLSGVEVTVSAIEDDTCRYQVDSVSRINTGWQNQTGFLNTELQVTPNNDYYQNLSYSIKSTKTFEEVIGPVNTLVHPSGLKNFADTKLETSGKLGIAATSSTEITLDFIGLTDVADTPLRVDRINNFDLGYDDEINNNRSAAIRFNSKTSNKRLTDFVEVRTNRVLLMDDISNEFIDADNARGQEPFTDFDVVTSDFTRGLLQVRDPFTDSVELIEIVVLAYSNDAFTLQKANVSDNPEGYGEFIGVSKNSTEYTLRFTNYDIETQDLDLKLLTNKFVFESGNPLFLGSTRLGGDNVSIESGETVVISSYSPDKIQADANTLYVQVIGPDGSPSYYEFYTFIIDGVDYNAVYGFDSNKTNAYNPVPDVEFSTRLAGGRLLVEATNQTSGRILLTTKTTEFLRSDSGFDPVYRFKRETLPDGTERSVNLTSDFSTGSATDPSIDITVFDASLIQSVRSVVFVKGTDFGSLTQVMNINSDGSTYTNDYPFLTHGDDLDPQAGIGSFGAELIGNNYTLKFYPDAGLTGPIEIYSYNEAFYREYDSVNYRNIPLTYAESEENYFLRQYVAPLGQRSNKVEFALTYQGIPIYEKEFNPADTITPFGSASIFNINDHFFSTGEELYYEALSSTDQVVPSPIEISPITIGSTTYTTMPERVFAVKRDLARLQLAPTEAEANLSTGQRINVVGFGSGNAHVLGMTKKLEKTLITIDGVIQAPIATTNKIYTLAEDATIDDEFMTLTGIGTIKAEDILLVNDEYIRLKNVGFGTTSGGPIDNTGNVPLIEVERAIVGSIATSHTANDDMELYRGSFNIVNSNIFFTEAPSGRGDQQLNENNLVEINSTFQGRTFLQREYDRITLFDDISDTFDGDTNTFELTTNSTAGVTTEVENGSGVLIINDVYQTPTTDNNEGNNYFFTYDAFSGINSVTFTGITSTNGQRVASEFDVNQNQIPRGGLIVSVGSTPGLGYAPLYGAVIEPIVVGGVVTGIEDSNVIGTTTNIQYAEYNNVDGILNITTYGVDLSPTFNVTDASYFKESGRLLVTGDSAFGGTIEKGSIVVLADLEFSCVNSGITTTIFPDAQDAFIVESVINDESIIVNVGISTIGHTYVSGGTFSSKQKIEFSSFGDPDFVYLNDLEFACPNGETAGLTTTIFPIPGEEGFPFVSRIDDATIRVFVGVSTIVHEYVGGGQVAEYRKHNPGSGYNTEVNILIYEEGHTGAAASVRGIPGPGGELTFVVDDGGSGWTQPQASAPDPTYANLPIRGVSRRTTGIGTETGKNLFVTVDVGAATTTAIGRSEYFEVSNYELTNQGYSFLPGDVIEVVGIVTDKRLSQPIEPFQITVTETFTDNFSAWNFGELDYIDSIKRLQDGNRTRFPLLYNNETIAFEQNLSDEDSAAVDLSSILLIYVNTVLQIPEVNYTFDGGTSFQFTRAPFAEDDIDIYFYRGKRNVDSRIVTDVNESIRPGDELQVRKNNAIDGTKTQDIRTVTDIAASDTVRTNTYFGRGDLDAVNPREVAWDKQKRDVFIYGEVYTKIRDSIEPIIKPNGSIIRDFKQTDSVIYVDNAYLFDYEEKVPGSPEVLTGLRARVHRTVEANQSPASYVATVQANGELSPLLTRLDPGSGYSPDVEVTITPPLDPNGTRAGNTNPSVFNGSINSIQVLDRGSGYDPANPPTVLIEPFKMEYEDIVEITSIQGFSGIITSIEATTGFGPGFSKGIRFGYRVEPGVIVAELQAGDSISVVNTVVGNGVISQGDTSSSLDRVGVGTQFIDCVYQVASHTPLSFTGVIEVNVSSSTNISAIDLVGDDLGQFGWGKIGVQRDIDNLPSDLQIDGTTFSSDMANYPQIIRTSGGLRDQGGIAKRV